MDKNERISQSQRERYERERQTRHLLRTELHQFALWLHPTWDDENEDDVEAALRCVDRYIADPSAGRADSE